MMLIKKFCANCGSKYADSTPIPTPTPTPKHCDHCGITAWVNPIPVVFVLQPVYDAKNGRLGLAAAQRANNPGAGEWAFMGGFVDIDDASFEEAACREFREETGLDVQGIAMAGQSELNAWSQMVIPVTIDDFMLYEDFTSGRVCDENLQLGVLWNAEDIKLCFPIHQKYLEIWFNTMHECVVEIFKNDIV